LNKIIPKNNDEGRAIYGNLENKINTLYWPVENSIPKNNDVYIYVKPPDEYPWQGRNSFNSGIFVILKKM
jgi:hypothetical protein